MCLKIKYFTGYTALAIPKFYQQQPLALGWDTQWCIKPCIKCFCETFNTGLKHQRPHNSCLMVKHLELARVI